MNDSEFPNVYEAFQPKILRYLAHLVGEAEAEDLTQEVLIKVNNALQGFRGEAQLSTWIYRIATNAALDRLRSPSYKRVIQNCSASAEAEVEDQDTLTGEKPPLVEPQIFRREMNECIHGFIQKLPENYRVVLVLSEFEGLKDSEIAETLGISPGAVKVRLHRAKERLKEELLAHCDSYWVEENEFLPELKKTSQV
ncbi:MAG TPA: sigma-70 family RNA polymerase sigma factor [Anaerolineales bacterium]|nr:sigma-70 family RNA polymerase sigma factor [Anaerolineales bacterium]